MKSKLFLVCIILFPVLLMAQENSPSSKINKTDRKGRKTGWWQYYHANSTTVATEGTYIKGMRDGEWKEYTKDGKLQQVGFFKEDKFSGTWKYFDANGKVVNERSYKDGKLDGENRSYSPDGNLLKVTVFKGGNEVKK